jgi:hypothetical protein
MGPYRTLVAHYYLQKGHSLRARTLLKEPRDDRKEVWLAPKHPRLNYDGTSAELEFKGYAQTTTIDRPK